MRRLILSLSCVGALVACDDKSTGPSTPTDTTAADTTAPTDTTAPMDTTAPTDTTTPMDTTAPMDTAGPTDTVQPQPDSTVVGPDPGEGICPGLLECVAECATEQCVTTCLGRADNNDEVALVNAYITCLDTNNCFLESSPATPEQIKAAIECERTNCLSENADCQSGGVYGSGTCRVIATCLQGCDEGDMLCERGCLAASSEAAVEAFFDVSLCATRECYGQPNFQTCAQQAVSAAGPCNATYNACFGDTGAAPGAGAGGGLPSAEMFERANKAFGAMKKR